MRIIAVTEQYPHLSHEDAWPQFDNWDGSLIEIKDLHDPDQLTDYDVALICPNRATQEHPWIDRIHEWKRQGLLRPDLALGSWKGYLYCHKPLFLKWISLGGSYCSRYCSLNDSVCKTKVYELPMALHELSLEGTFGPDVGRESKEALPIIGHEAFCGGVKDRNFKLAMDACEKANQECYFVHENNKAWPFVVEELTKREDLPLSLEDYKKKIKSSLFTIVPVKTGDYAHGHWDITKSLLCEKPVLCTKRAGCDQYIEHKVNGYLANETVGDYVRGIKYLQENAANMINGVNKALDKHSYKCHREELYKLCEIVYEDRGKSKVTAGLSRAQLKRKEKLTKKQKKKLARMKLGQLKNNKNRNKR